MINESLGNTKGHRPKPFCERDVPGSDDPIKFSNLCMEVSIADIHVYRFIGNSSHLIRMPEGQRLIEYSMNSCVICRRLEKFRITL